MAPLVSYPAGAPPITILAYAVHRGAPGSNGVIHRIVIHDEEYPVSDTSGEAIAKYFATAAAGGCAHYVEDGDGEEHCVPDNETAWHAPPNPHSIGIEGDGYARFTPADWQTDGSQRTMRRIAARAAELCVRYNLPAVWITQAQLERE